METLARPTDLYALLMAKRELLGVQEMRENLRDRVDQAIEQGVHTVVSRHARAVAVLVDIDWYRRAAESLGEPTDL